MRPPADLIPSFLELHTETDYGFFLELVPNPVAHREGCRVYWGSHGCERPRGHDGPHWCDCCDCDDHPGEGCVGGPPYFGSDTRFYGDDAA